MEEAVLNLNTVIQEAEETQKDLYLTFRLADEDYGMEIFNVIEIVGIQKITNIPDMPEYIKGIINLRGSVIPVMDARLKFGMPKRQYDDRTCLIVVRVNETTSALVVDCVNEVLEIPTNQIEPAPRTRRDSGGYISGMGKMGDSVKILLDMDRLLNGPSAMDAEIPVGEDLLETI